jgi:hypothetical protein
MYFHLVKFEDDMNAFRVACGIPHGRICLASGSSYLGERLGGGVQSGSLGCRGGVRACWERARYGSNMRDFSQVIARLIGKMMIN